VILTKAIFRIHCNILTVLCQCPFKPKKCECLIITFCLFSSFIDDLLRHRSIMKSAKYRIT